MSGIVGVTFNFVKQGVIDFTKKAHQNWPCAGLQMPEKLTLSKLKYENISATIKIAYYKMGETFDFNKLFEKLMEM